MRHSRIDLDQRLLSQKPRLSHTAARLFFTFARSDGEHGEKETRIGSSQLLRSH
jgi:hypothetical protein